MERRGVVAVCGATGLVGTRLCARLTERGTQVLRLVRRRPIAESGEVFWDPQRKEIDAAALEGVDAVVNLAGESIASGRWSSEKKRRILDSRVGGASLLAEALAELRQPPQILVNASAIGYYGDRGSEELDESALAGQGFLAQVCQAWEAAAIAAESWAERVVLLRIGVVFSTEGGALTRMLLPFKLGLGGRLGSGNQYVSWIHLEDLVSVIELALASGDLRGPVNAVAPQAVTNRELTRELGRVLRRPTLAPVPAFVLRALLGEMGQELLLASTRVVPRSLAAAGFRWQAPDLPTAMRQLLAG